MQIGIGVEPEIENVRIEIFADGADLGTIRSLASDPLIAGFTTNPTLLHKAGVSDYERFSREVIELVPDRPISFEVLSDTIAEIQREALLIASWGDQVFVKIPIRTSDGCSLAPLAKSLANLGVKVNATALMTTMQVREATQALADGPESFISVFAGRVADTGRDPIPLMIESLEILASHPNIRLIWASPRELLNIFQADTIGCDVITVSHDILAKLPLVGRDLEDYSIETIRMFFKDAAASGCTLPIDSRSGVT